MGSHVVMKPDSDSNEAPGIIDKEYDFGKRQWMQDKLFRCETKIWRNVNKIELIFFTLWYCISLRKQSALNSLKQLENGFPV